MQLVCETPPPVVRLGRRAVGLHVETVSDYASFVALERAWNHLIVAAGIDHPFVTHQWMRTWWECFGAGKQLHIVVVRDGAQIVGIAPLMLSRGWMYGLRLRCLQLLHNDHTPRLEFIVARTHPRAYGAIWNHLTRSGVDWDVLELRQLLAGSPTLEQLTTLATQDGFLTGLWHSADSPFLTVSGSWDDYFKTLDRKHRSNLRNRFKRLNTLGPVQLEVVSSAGQLDCALEDGMRLEAAAWKGDAGTAIGCQLELRRFYRELAFAATDRGWLRLHFLKVAGQRIAFDYSLAYANKMYLLKGGYDPQYSAYSPSNLLRDLVLRNTFEQHIAEYDFLGSSEDWKREWTRQMRPHSWLFIFPNRVPARLVHYAKFHLIPTIKRHHFTAPDPDVRSSLAGSQPGFLPVV